MDITTITTGTLFRLFQDVFVAKSEHYYSPRFGIHMIKAINVSTGATVELGMAAMFEAQPLDSQESERK